jgi:mono/diheme cytochrome c family protein
MRIRVVGFVVLWLALLALPVSVFADDADVPYTVESINKGRALFVTLCTACHGQDGKAQIDVVANATDLTDPSGYKHGSDNASIDKSIKDGAGAVMPAWGPVLKNPADIVHLRNFIQSLWPENQRPPLQK